MSRPTPWQASFLQLYRALSSHYGAAFLRGTEEDRRLDHINHWQRTLYEARIASTEMKAVFDDAIKNPRYRQFPPNPGEVVSMVMWSRAKEAHGIPEPEEAYRQACGLTGEAHPLVKQVRTEYGGWLLRTQDSSRTRSRFVELYLVAAEELARGERSLSPSVEVGQEPEEEVLPGDELTSRIDRLLSGGPSGP